MRGTSLLALLILALAAEQASAWRMHHKHHHHRVCHGKKWDRHFPVVNNNFIDPAAGQFAQKAFNTVLVQTTAAAVRTGVLPKGSKWAAWKLHEGCYSSIVPGSLKGKQYLGEYEFLYKVGYKVPGRKHLHWVWVKANSYNRRHFPWFEMIVAYMW